MKKSTTTKKRVVSKKVKPATKPVRRGAVKLKTKAPLAKKNGGVKKGFRISDNEILMATIALLFITGCSLLFFPF